WMTVTDAPPRTKVMAAAAPAGPAPTTTTRIFGYASFKISSKPSCRHPTSTSGSGTAAGWVLTPMYTSSGPDMSVMLIAAPDNGPNGNVASMRAPARNTSIGAPGTFDV